MWLSGWMECRLNPGVACTNILSTTLTSSFAKIISQQYPWSKVQLSLSKYFENNTLTRYLQRGNKSHYHCPTVSRNWWTCCWWTWFIQLIWRLFIDRGRAKVCVLTEMSLFFLSQINTFNASSSLKKNCNKFMYWNHGQRISCMIIWESLQRFLFIWNNFFLCFWSLQHFF